MARKSKKKGFVLRLPKTPKSWVLSFFAVMGSLFIVYVLINMLVDYRRMSLVKSDLDEAYALLQKEGFVLEKNDGCYRTQVVFGSGAKICETSITGTEKIDPQYDTDEKKAAWANERQGEFLELINSLNVFQSNSEVSKVKIPGSGNGGRYSGHIKTSIACGAGVYYIDTDNSLRFRLGCRTTPWFARTFDNGKFAW
jgi:hypothetical protein